MEGSKGIDNPLYATFFIRLTGTNTVPSFMFTNTFSAITPLTRTDEVLNPYKAMNKLNVTLTLNY